MPSLAHGRRAALYELALRTWASAADVQCWFNERCRTCAIVTDGALYEPVNRGSEDVGTKEAAFGDEFGALNQRKPQPPLRSSNRVCLELRNERIGTAFHNVGPLFRSWKSQ